MNAILHITINAKDRRGNELFLFCKKSNLQKVSTNKGMLITSSALLSIWTIDLEYNDIERWD